MAKQIAVVLFLLFGIAKLGKFVNANGFSNQLVLFQYTCTTPCMKLSAAEKLKVN